MKRLSARRRGGGKPGGEPAGLEIEIQFHYPSGVMACALHPPLDPAAERAPSARGAAGSGFARAVPRAMTRCECAGVSFQEVAREMAATGRSLEEASRRTGCGQNCSACLPDLLKHFAPSF
jgi:bacterioferritin-associated ferredoxin